MSRRPKAYVAALPAAAIPELQELLRQFTGSDEARGNVVMVRLADGALSKVDSLVDSGLFGSRSEAAAFLIGTGIDANKDLLDQAVRQSAEIQKIRRNLGDALVASLRRRKKTRS